MSDTIKCACPNCHAKYRLPAEAAGRDARCKVCGSKFHIPQNKSLEDSVLDWLSEAPADPEDAVDRPRVINMPRGNDDSTAGGRRRSVIRMKDEHATDKAEAKDR